MDPRIVAMIARGSGLVTAADMAALDIDPEVRARWVRSGELVAVRRGIYTSRSFWEASDPYDGKPRLRVVAACLTLRVPYVVSHDSAAILHGMRLIRPQDADQHVTRRELRGTVSRYGIHHHAARFLDERETVVDGIPVLDIPRTVIDLARTHGYLEGLCAADGALAAGITRAELARAASEFSRCPGIKAARQVAANCRYGAESLAETLGRDLCEEAGLVVDEIQFPVMTRSGLRWGDIRTGRHLVEISGFIKVLPKEHGGVATESAAQVLWQERRRQQDICAEGFGMSNLEWRDFWGSARQEAITRLRREAAVTRERYGDQVPHEKAEFARRVRAERYPAA